MGGAAGPEAGGFHGFLQGHAVVDEVEDGLHDGAEDAEAAGDAEGVAGVAVLQDEGGGLRGGDALAGGDAEGAAGGGVEEEHVVVADEAGAGDHDAGAEQAVDGLGAGDGEAGVVGDGEVGGVGFGEGGDAGGVALGAGRVDGGAAAGCVGAVDEGGDGTATKSGSAVAAARSAKAILRASAMRWRRAGLPGGRDGRSKPSRMLSIWMMWTPEEAGGGGAMISWPR